MKKIETTIPGKTAREKVAIETLKGFIPLTAVTLLRM